MLNMDMPLVSIIIPVYNAEKYLERTIRSAMDQTWVNKEIILVDDGSTDHSLRIAKKFECGFIKVYSQKNKGAGVARNSGLSKAKGDFIQFLDADDLLDRDKISLQMLLIKDKNSVLATCPVVHFTNDQAHHLTELSPNEYELKFYGDHNNPFEFLMNLYGVKNNEGSMIPVHSWLTPAAVLRKAGAWNEELTLNDDGEFFCRVVISSSAIVNAADTFCYYRKDPFGKSLSSGKSPAALNSQYQSIELIESHLRGYSKDERISTVISRMMMELLIQVYPQHPELALKIQGNLGEFGGNTYRPQLGGTVIELISHISGWKFARMIQYHYQNLKFNVLNSIKQKPVE